MTEIWKDIPNYASYYQASDLGRIRRLTRESFNGVATFTLEGRVLKQVSAGKMGYMQVALSKDCKPKTFRVHVLIALSFLGERPRGHHVGHLDGDPRNNRASNLKYLTVRENIHQSYEDSGVGANRNGGKGQLLEYAGEKLTLGQWARRIGCHRDCLKYRMRMGWSIDQMLTHPIAHKKNKGQLIEYRGEEKPVSQWARELGLNPRTIQYRLEKGLSAHDALNLPCQPGIEIAKRISNSI